MNIQSCGFSGGRGCFWFAPKRYSTNSAGKVWVSLRRRQEQKSHYEQVCMGNTGHAEVIKIEFQSAEVSFRDLMTGFSPP
jgi:peptide-methionine (S)-S-oxide reductase